MCIRDRLSLWLSSQRTRSRFFYSQTPEKRFAFPVTLDVYKRQSQNNVPEPLDVIGELKMTSTMFWMLTSTKIGPVSYTHL